MFAMLAAFGAEVRTGAPLFVQIQQTPVAIAAAFATIIIASVIPVLRGANLDRDGAGPFTQACVPYAARCIFQPIVGCLLVGWLLLSSNALAVHYCFRECAGLPAHCQGLKRHAFAPRYMRACNVVDLKNQVP